MREAARNGLPFGAPSQLVEAPSLPTIAPIGTAFVARLAPPEMSGKITAVHILWVGMIGTAVGATLYAAVSDRFFQGPMALAYSMSVVVGVLDVLAVLAYLLLMRVTRDVVKG
jgi:dipeptide/tripeptide permease